ncbi:MAG: iron-sulfur cluster repair di-iron protein [Planctomycetes bacterium]|nr:iron-sulfur cluster repair di-iron protein [Planctomycetota bacterium]
MSITQDTPVGTIAAEFPLATRVFARHQIDFCCGGGIPLITACAKKAIDVDKVLAELQAEIAPGAQNEESRWDQSPMPELIDHLLKAYHVPQLEELDRILAMTQKVHDVHGDKDQAMFDELLKTVTAMHTDLVGHFAKEEDEIFPALLSGKTDEETLAALECDHEEVGEMLRTIRRLTNDFTVPAAACNTWTALWHAFADIEQGLHMHIHLENNVLLPAARAAK